MNIDYDVWLGLEIGKAMHHGCGLNPAGERVFDRELPQDEVAHRHAMTNLEHEHGRALVIVD